MMLPYDYSRCSGFKEKEQCSDCLRRTSPGRDNWQSFILPKKQEDCDNYINPKEYK